MVPPIHLGAWSMALMLWLPFELLLEELADSGCGCYWRNLFAGAFCYADDYCSVGTMCICSQSDVEYLLFVCLKSWSQV